MKGYKAFEKGLICKGKQYAENTVFEEPEAIPDECGMHFCENPMDVFYYYNLVDENGEITEFAEVESLDEPVTDTGIKYCSTKLKIHEKLPFPRFIHACINFFLKKKDDILSKYPSYIISSEDHSLLASSETYSCIASFGMGPQIVNSGSNSRIISSGYSSQLANSGNTSYLISSGSHSQIASAGYYSQQASSGSYSHLASSGGFSEQASSGIRSCIANSGSCSNIASLGNYSHIASSGDDAHINSKGEYSVICCAGNSSQVKAKKGSWITLSEWVYENGREIPKCVKTEYVDGERIKEDTFYTLKDGEFVEVEK